MVTSPNGDLDRKSYGDGPTTATVGKVVVTLSVDPLPWLVRLRGLQEVERTYPSPNLLTCQIFLRKWRGGAVVIVAFFGFLAAFLQ